MGTSPPNAVSLDFCVLDRGISKDSEDDPLRRLFLICPESLTQRLHVIPVVSMPIRRVGIVMVVVS